MDYLISGLLTIIGTCGYLAYRVIVMRIGALEATLRLGVPKHQIDAIVASLRIADPRWPRAVPNQQIMIGDTESGFKIG